MLCGTRAISARSVGICDGVPSTARSSLFSGFPRWNIVKENDISTLCIHGKETGSILSQNYAS